MFRTKFLTFRFVIALIFVLVLSATAYAFAAANTVDASKAGDGAGTIAGYAVTAIKYEHDTDRTKIKKVSFVINETAPTNVYARFTDSPTAPTVFGDWSTICTLTTGRYACDFGTAVEIVGMKALQVVASSNVTP